jgi:hypothetical protein
MYGLGVMLWRDAGYSNILSTHNDSNSSKYWGNKNCMEIKIILYKIFHPTVKHVRERQNALLGTFTVVHL